MLVGENVRFYRKKAGLTQKQLADKANISGSYIQQLERGEKNNMSVNYAKSISSALNIELNDLYATIPKTIGQLIKDARKEMGLKQYQFSSMVGIPNNTLRQYEGNNRTPKYESLVKIAKGLNKPMSYFYSEHNETSQEPQQQEEPTINLKRMSVEEINQLIIRAANELVSRI